MSNAGITKDGLLLRMSEDDFTSVHRRQPHRRLPGRQARRAGHAAGPGRAGIIFMSSVVGLLGSAGQANYAASKAGLVGLARSLARELGSRSITVNVVAPGPVATDMTAALGEKRIAELTAAVPLGADGDARRDRRRRRVPRLARCRVHHRCRHPRRRRPGHGPLTSVPTTTGHFNEETAVDQELFARFKKCAVEVLSVVEDQVVPEAKFGDDLDADSLDLVELVMALEDLESAAVSRRIVRFARGALVFAQGAQANSVFFLQDGGVKLSVLSSTGKEAVVAMLGPGRFLWRGMPGGAAAAHGHGGRVGRLPSLAFKQEMVRVLHEQPEFSERFISHMLSRNIRIEEDLVDQLFNSSEKRLARTLLLLALRERGQTQRIAAKDVAGNAGRDGRYHSVAREFLHEQVPQARVHRIQRRPEVPQLPAQYRPPRLTVREGGVPFRASSVAESLDAQPRSRCLDVEPATAERPSRDLEGAFMPKGNMARPQRHHVERAPAEAERLRQRAEEAREAGERNLGDRWNASGKRKSGPVTLARLIRVAAEGSRAALPTMAARPRSQAVRDTTLLLQATLTQMKVVEDMRRGYRAPAGRKRKPAASRRSRSCRDSSSL